MVLELEPWLEASQEDWRVIDVEDWAEIRRLHRAEGLSIKAITRRLGVARNTVRDALRSDEPPRYEVELLGCGRGPGDAHVVVDGYGAHGHDRMGEGSEQSDKFVGAVVTNGRHDWSSQPVGAVLDRLP